MTTLDDVKAAMEARLKTIGVSAYITFCRTDMFSIATETREAHIKVRAVFDRVRGIVFDSESTDHIDDFDADMGYYSYYRF